MFPNPFLELHILPYNYMGPENVATYISGNFSHVQLGSLSGSPLDFHALCIDIV